MVGLELPQPRLAAFSVEDRVENLIPARDLGRRRLGPGVPALIDRWKGGAVRVDWLVERLDIS